MRKEWYAVVIELLSPKMIPNLSKMSIGMSGKGLAHPYEHQHICKLATYRETPPAVVA
jgi:hypothetical protein